jgi:hypothetical protein
MAVRNASRVACRLELFEEPEGASMRLSAPLVPPPAIHLAELPLTVKVCVDAGAQDRSCCPLIVTEVIARMPACGFDDAGHGGAE